MSEFRHRVHRALPSAVLGLVLGACAGAPEHGGDALNDMPSRPVFDRHQVIDARPVALKVQRNLADVCANMAESAPIVMNPDRIITAHLEPDEYVRQRIRFRKYLAEAVFEQQGNNKPDVCTSWHEYGFKHNGPAAVRYLLTEPTDSSLRELTDGIRVELSISRVGLAHAENPAFAVAVIGTDQPGQDFSIEVGGPNHGQMTAGQMLKLAHALQW